MQQYGVLNRFADVEPPPPHLKKSTGMLPAQEKPNNISEQEHKNVYR